ncbi:MAG: hypothetical protein A2V85_02380 [Chloroflexi bacterium RBG_16_72_14]|nr:MAG: hypothetical protein A2V85_02380 [Chloroflexi bacterium RBG_16_72_14]
MQRVTIAISLPLTGDPGVGAASARDGALLAIEDFELDGYLVRTLVLDHAVNGTYDERQGADDMTELVANEDVIAVVGPFNSAVARAQIPIGNQAGLLQCSPATTNPGITSGPAGADLRRANPDRIAFIRVSTTDDFQGPALARFGFDELDLRRVAVIDDGQAYGDNLANAFGSEFQRLGGTVVERRTVQAGIDDEAVVVEELRGSDPDGVLFGGLTITGGAAFRHQMGVAGMGDLAFLAGDGIVDGPGSVGESYIGLTGPAAANSFGAIAAIAEFPGRDAFSVRYLEAFSTWPGAYSAPGHACAEVILDSIRVAAARGVVTREAVRAAATDTTRTFDTVLGPLQFDEVGDTSLKVVSIYGVDPAAANGTGDWIYDSQVTLGGE